MKQFIIKKEVIEVVDVPAEMEQNADFLLLYNKIMFEDPTPEQVNLAEETEDAIMDFIDKGKYPVRSIEEIIDSAILTDNNGNDYHIY